MLVYRSVTPVIPKNPFVCPKEGIGPPIYFFRMGFGNLNPIRSEGYGFLGNATVAGKICGISPKNRTLYG